MITYFGWHQHGKPQTALDLFSSSTNTLFLVIYSVYFTNYSLFISFWLLHIWWYYLRFFFCIFRAVLSVELNLFISHFYCDSKKKISYSFNFHLLLNSLKDFSEGDEMDFYSQRHSILTEFFQSLWFALISNTDLICYLLVYINMVHSHSILALPMPLMVFLWGTLTVPRPSKTFWITLIAYTQVIESEISVYPFSNRNISYRQWNFYFEGSFYWNPSKNNPEINLQSKYIFFLLYTGCRLDKMHRTAVLMARCE